MGRNHQILLVDPDADHRAQLKQMLGSLEFAVVGEANYGVEAARLAAELRPDVALVHLEEPLALALRTIEVIQEVAPHTTPAVVSRRVDAGTAYKAMLAGARGYLVSPPDYDALRSMLIAAYERHQVLIERLASPGGSFNGEPVAGSVITVFGPKGGVGKTTLSTNLAVAIAKRTHARVIVVDGDIYFGDVAISMGMEPERTVAEYIQELEAGEDPDVRQFITEHPCGVHLLAAQHSGYMRSQPDPDHMALMLRRLAATFDFVVVDTPGAFSPLVAAALDESTTSLLVTSADMASIKDARMSLDALRDEGFSTDRVKLVVNHSTNANSVTEADVANTVNYEIFWSLPHDTAVPHSTQRGEPLVLSNPRAIMAQQVEALAGYFSGSLPVVEPEPQGGLMGIFRRR